MIYQLLFTLIVAGLFFRVAKVNQQSPLIYAFLGVVSFYAGKYMGGFLVAILMEMAGYSTFYLNGNLAVELISIFFGLLACWLAFKLMKSGWHKDRKRKEEKRDRDD